MKHVKDFANWRMNEGSVKNKLIEIAEQAIRFLEIWMPIPEKDLEKMPEPKRKEEIAKHISVFFDNDEVDKTYTESFLEENREVIIDLISEYLVP